MDNCVGPLIRFDVPAGDRDVNPDKPAVIECRGCGDIFFTDFLGEPALDNRHRTATLAESVAS